MSFQRRLLEIDVGRVASIKFFREPIAYSSKQPSLKQYLMVGMFTADLEFLSKFLGHQGACARFLCMFCLIVKAQCKQVFDDPDNPAVVPKRTLEMIKENAKTYNDIMSKYNEEEKERLRPEVTKGKTNSIVAEPMVDWIVIEEDCSTATLHVILGITAWIVKVTRKAFRRLEELEAKKTGAGQALPANA
mmetsp:Transcript_11461/g.19847  ORF Transcript_11461/g.19847 Transcript_11461/m.19847 type:complete len:190 (+) Transcript_11461:644-1213(+)